jgi:putative ABC transport system permease protein
MGIPILRGRGLEERDRGMEAPRVVVVNDAFARRHRQEGDLIGDRLMIQMAGAPSPERFEIIGVAANTFNDGWGRPIRPAVYLLFDQFPSWDAFLVARTRLDAASAFEAIRHGVQSVDNQVPLSLFRTMDGALAEANWQIRFYSWLFAVFSLIATILAAAGVYGVMAYTVASRTREFGIRIALGGGPRGIVALAARQGLVLSGIGLIAGCLISVAGMQLLAGLLFQVHYIDTGVYGIALLLMGIVALVASCVPALPLFKLSPTNVLLQN